MSFLIFFLNCDQAHYDRENGPRALIIFFLFEVEERIVLREV